MGLPLFWEALQTPPFSIQPVFLVSDQWLWTRPSLGLFPFRLHLVRVSGLIIVSSLCAGFIDKLSTARDSCAEEPGSEGQLTPKRLAGDVLFSLVSLGSFRDDLPRSDSSVQVDGFISIFFSQVGGMAFSLFAPRPWLQRRRVGQLWFYWHETNKLDKTSTKTDKKDTKNGVNEHKCLFFYLWRRAKNVKNKLGSATYSFYEQLPGWITVKYIFIGRVHCVSKIGVMPQHLEKTKTKTKTKQKRNKSIHKKTTASFK